MYFLFYARAFDDVMKLKYLKYLKFDIPENEKSFWGEIKSIFPSFTRAFLST